MEKFVSERGKVYPIFVYVLMGLMVAGLLLSVFFLTGVLRIILCIAFPIAFAIGIWILCATYYVFEENELLCKCGPFSERIPYEKIKTATKCRGYMFSLVLSELRIELKYGRSDADTVFISPVNEDDFLDLLCEKCPNLEIYEA